MICVITSRGLGHETISTSSITVNPSPDARTAPTAATVDGRTSGEPTGLIRGGLFSTSSVADPNAQGPRRAVAADLDGDSDLDVLAASAADDKIARYENVDGRGNFAPPKVITTNADWAADVYPADLDGDGDLDVLSALRGNGKITWYENLDGRGNFGGQRVVATIQDLAITSPTTVYAADLDGDGDLDVLGGAGGRNDMIAWYENLDGNGNFGSQKLITTFADFPRWIRAADLDGDGDMDVLSASDDSKVAWYENLDGQGLFGQQKVVATGPSYGAMSVEAADLDGDGDLDILAGWVGSHYEVSWYENRNGRGDFALGEIISTDVPGGRSVCAADLDGDGDLDVASASFSAFSDKIAWYENTNGRGNFGAEEVIATREQSNFPISIYAADLDGDGDMDVLSASVSDDNIAWYENANGTGAFGAPRLIVSDNKASGVWSVSSADLDEDGDLDLVSASSADHKIAWYDNTDGRGAFQPATDHKQNGFWRGPTADHRPGW